MNKENLSLSDRITNALNIFTNNEEDLTYDNRIAIIAHLKYLKEQLDSGNFKNNKDSPSVGDNMSIEQGNCIKYISQIQQFKEIKDNPNLMKLVHGLSNQIKNQQFNQYNYNQMGNNFFP